MKLLTRDQFREGVFARDKNKCVLCGDPAQDAHHILERRLWPDGGYYVGNGASVCGPCHMACETTEISVEDVRYAAGIAKILVPDHLYPDQPYDKWGNPVLPNGQRARGELFFDESVQKVIAPYLDLFTHYIKYPRTYHLPWSECIPDDDRAASSMAHWEGKRVIATIKMDGECLQSTSRIAMADGSFAAIGDLVRHNRVGEYVIGVNQDGVPVPSRITRVFFNGRRTAPWMRIRLKGQHGHSQCVVSTPDHQILTRRGYIAAKDIDESDVCYTYDSSLDMTSTQRQVILGKLLGDGSLHLKTPRGWTDNSRALVQFSHKKDHKEYVEWTRQWLGDLSAGMCDDTTSRYGNTPMIKSWTKQTHAIYAEFAPMISSGNKIVSSSIANSIDPIALAFWYMDDGSVMRSNTQRDRMLISVCGFDVDSCIALQQGLKRLGVDSSVRTFTGYRYLYINHTNAIALSRIVSPYVPPVMRYKLVGDDLLPVVDPPAGTNKLDYRLMELGIIDIQSDYDNKYTGKYDIETETHNYFANHTLVHNCTSMYTDYFHARSVDSQNHPSRNWAKNAWSQFAGDIPEGWRICAENLYAQHSIAYDDLPSYLMGFSVWNERNVCLSWDETVEWMWLFGLPHVPVIYDGIYDEKKIRALWNPADRDKCEGYVLRLADEFDYSQFRTSVAKFVRKDHVQTNKHWAFGQRIIPNGLKT